MERFHHRLSRLIDSVSRWLFRLSFVASAVMIGAVAAEVWSRYVVGVATLWAFDVTYMANGAILILAAAWTLREDQHVRIDILDGRLRTTGRRWLDGIFYILIAVPITGALAWAAAGRAWRAFATSELEMVSPWQPHIWPFRAILAIGLTSLALQCAAKGLRAVRGPEAPVEGRRDA